MFYYMKIMDLGPLYVCAYYHDRLLVTHAYGFFITIYYPMLNKTYKFQMLVYNKYKIGLIKLQ